MSAPVRSLIRTALTSLEDAIDKELQIKSATRREALDASGGGFKEILNALNMSLSLMLEALGKIQIKSCDPESARIVINEMVRFFQGVLGQVHAILLHCASINQHVEGRSYRIKQRQKNSTDGSQIDAASNLCWELTRILNTMFTILDLSKAGHRQLLEGLACAYLDHLGSCLSLVVFADDDGTSRSGSLGILTPQGLQDTQDVDVRVATRTVLLESPYLVAILKQLMKIVSDQPGGNRTHSHGRRPVDEVFNGFVSTIRTKFQHTLLRGVFGDDDPAFREALSRVEHLVDDNLGQTEPMPEPESNTKEWFIGQTWEILGWHILSEEMDI